jgi:hypothetical protein
MTQGHLAKEQE